MVPRRRAVGNLLTAEGRLAAVIDFGTCGVGDPACDLVIAWTFFAGNERQIFREAVKLPDDAWARARGWALWKALITVTDPTSPQFEIQAHTLAELLEAPFSALTTQTSSPPACGGWTVPVAESAELVHKRPIGTTAHCLLA